MKDISIVVPVFNEEKNLPILTDKLKKVLDSMDRSYECIFVDDGSGDNSYAVLTQLKGEHDFIRVVKLKKNCVNYFAKIAGLSSNNDALR